MYEAPDRYKRMISARLPGGESLGLSQEVASRDDMSSPLRDTQLLARSQLAAFFASANAVAALLLAASLYGHVSIVLLLGWTGAVAVGNLAAMHLARTQAITHVGRSGRKVPQWQMVGEVLARALLFLSLPVFCFSSLTPDLQVVTASILAGLGVAALGLVVVPACVTAWMSCFVGGAQPDPGAWRARPFRSATCCRSCSRSASRCSASSPSRAGRSASSKTNADVGSQSESASLLLQEYEQRGVGWLWQVDGENRVTYISSRMTALLGRPSSAILGHSLPALLGGHAELGRVLLGKQPFNSLEMELKTARGTRWISIAGDPIIDTAGRFEGFRGVGSDITEVRQTQERLTHLANMDVLSGLPNRGRVRQLLGEALRTAVAGNVPCAIMFLDLDGFKPVNDTFGHPKGDAVLQAVAKRLCDEVGDDGHVGRMGGDEFAIVITDAQSRLKVESLADRILKSIAEPYMIDQTEIRIGVSIGCAFGPIDGATVDDLILKADLALYEAKGAGRGMTKYFSSALQSEQEDRIQLETDLRTAIAAKQFHLVYQPLVNAKTQKLVGFEALIRWNHPQARADPAAGVHPGRRGMRADAAAWRMGHRGSGARRRDLARADHRRDQHQPQADRRRRRCPTSSARRCRATRCPATASSSKSPKACSLATATRRST